MAPIRPPERAPANPDAPSEEMQKLMAELERLDKQADGLPPEQLAANIEQRAEHAESTGRRHARRRDARPVVSATDRHAERGRAIGQLSRKASSGSSSWKSGSTKPTPTKN